MKRAKLAKKQPRPRNPVARSPLLGKGGVHEKSISAKRQQAKRDLAARLRQLDDE